MRPPISAEDTVARITSRTCSRPSHSYTSIPQRSRACQLLSIASLPAYTAHAQFFLIVAPTVTVSGNVFDLSTYQRRGWYVR